MAGDIERVLSHSPRDRRELAKAIEGLWPEDPEFAAYRIGKKAYVLGIGDMPNPYPHDDPMHGRWRRQFDKGYGVVKAGHERQQEFSARIRAGDVPVRNEAVKKVRANPLVLRKERVRLMGA